MPSIDDKEDMQFADEAYDILGFTKEEKYNVYKVSHLSLSSSLYSCPDISICPGLRITEDLLSHPDIWGFQVLMGGRGLLSAQGTLLWYLGATRLNTLTQHYNALRAFYNNWNIPHRDLLSSKGYYVYYHILLFMNSF